jgi:hypothetical protein
MTKASEQMRELMDENKRLRDALKDVHDDLIIRAGSKGYVSVGRSVWIKITEALGEKTQEIKDEEPYCDLRGDY